MNRDPAAPPPPAVNAVAETSAMRRAYYALKDLDRDARFRALNWLQNVLRTEEPPF